jgi:prophage antirepressor-like protein
MPGMELITLNSPVGRLDGFREGEKIWLRVVQLCTTLAIDRSTLTRMLQRDAELVMPGESAMLPDATAGGDQMVRAYSFEAAMNIAMEVQNRRARKLRRWMVQVLLGMRRLSARPDTTAIAQAPNPLDLITSGAFQAGLGHWQEAARIQAQGNAAAEHERKRAENLWRNIGLSREQARALIDVQKALAAVRLPSGATQATLPLDA